MGIVQTQKVNRNRQIHRNQKTSFFLQITFGVEAINGIAQVPVVSIRKGVFT
jgi:hypothetical protein